MILQNGCGFARCARGGGGGGTTDGARITSLRAGWVHRGVRGVARSCTRSARGGGGTTDGARIISLRAGWVHRGVRGVGRSFTRCARGGGGTTDGARIISLRAIWVHRGVRGVARSCTRSAWGEGAPRMGHGSFRCALVGCTAEYGELRGVARAALGGGRGHHGWGTDYCKYERLMESKSVPHPCPICGELKTAQRLKLRATPRPLRFKTHRRATKDYLISGTFFLRGRLLVLLLVLTAASCQEEAPPPKVAFYHWETQLDPHPDLLAQYAADRLYIKIFDVSWNNGRAEPAAILQAGDTLCRRRQYPSFSSPTKYSLTQPTASHGR